MPVGFFDRIGSYAKKIAQKIECCGSRSVTYVGRFMTGCTSMAMPEEDADGFTWNNIYIAGVGFIGSSLVALYGLPASAAIISVTADAIIGLRACYSEFCYPTEVLQEPEQGLVPIQELPISRFPSLEVKAFKSLLSVLAVFELSGRFRGAAVKYSGAFGFSLVANFLQLKMNLQDNDDNVRHRRPINPEPDNGLQPNQQSEYGPTKGS